MDEAARHCDACGADLRSMPRGTVAPPSAAAVAAPPPAPVPYRPEAPRAWWFPIGLWLLASGFLLLADFATTGGILWSYWPIGLLGIFMAGFPLLHRLEERSLARGKPPG